MAKKVGRPSKFDNLNFKDIERYVRAGLTDEQLCVVLKIHKQSLYNYQKKYPKLFDSLKNCWKLEADGKVEKSLYQRALGYKYDEVTYEKSKTGGLGLQLSAGEIEHIKHCDTYKTKITVKEVAPDVTAQIFWLKNRQPEVWRDSQHFSGEIKVNLSEIIKKARERSSKSTE